MVTSDSVAECRRRIEADVEAALGLFSGERYSLLRERIEAEASALRMSLLAAELEVPRQLWSAELLEAVHPEHRDPLLQLAADEAGVELPPGA
jgi:hypothetical protein